VALLAPGVLITAAGKTESGTSQATPFVAAAVALVRQKYPLYTRDQIVALLTSTGVPVRPAPCARATAGDRVVVLCSCAAVTMYMHEMA
jgi:subtilisin family serine protease